MLTQSNPAGVPNQEVLFRLSNAADITGRSRGYFIVDFGQRSLDEAQQYRAPFTYVLQHVKPFRNNNRDRQRREYWWRHGRSGNQLRSALAPLARQIATPEVSKHRVFVWLPATTVVTQTIKTFVREDDYFFGVLHSKLHELWSLRLCTWLGVGNDPRYTPTTTFETYPFPWPPGKESQDDPRVQAIAEAAKELVELRDGWLNPPGLSEKELQKRTLTNLYNERPAWLDAAHRKLDVAVFEAYGWPHDLSNEEVLARLLALNLERAGTGSLASA